jgi:MOSC domain-containing protein YiiM
VHLLHAELLDRLGVQPGELGENVTTSGVDLLGLSTGTLLRLGPEAVVEVMGLRNPCVQIENHREGLLAQVVGRDDAGEVVRQAGVMAVVLTGGVVHPGDPVTVVLPDVHVPLQKV